MVFLFSTFLLFLPYKIYTIKVYLTREEHHTGIMNIIDDLLEFYNATPQGDIYRDAIMHLMDNLTHIRGATIYQMADMCYVSPSTISRLCRRLGCENYSTFREEILHVLDHYDDYNRIVPSYMVTADKDENDILLDTIEAAVADLRTLDRHIYEELADVIHSAKLVGIYSYGNSSSTVFLQNALIVAGQKVRPHNSRRHFDDTSQFGQGSVVIFQYPYFKATQHLTSALRECKENKATTILIATHAPASLGQYCDYFYNFEGRQTIMDNYKRDFFFDMVVMAYRRKYIDRRESST